tara:strand:+ start:279 stop:413 length:135 start_codon:yes stop_codon:yes gene_type:complete
MLRSYYSSISINFFIHKITPSKFRFEKALLKKIMMHLKYKNVRI